MALRLDKYLAEIGVGTRSEVKKLIKAKQITVNGVPALKPENIICFISRPAAFLPQRTMCIRRS